jgi:uncharacterized cupin superfamily protein
MGKPDETTKRWLDPASVTPRVGSIYPAPFVAPLAGREKRAANLLGLTQFGVNLVTLGPRSGIGMKTRTSSFMCSKGR